MRPEGRDKRLEQMRGGKEITGDRKDRKKEKQREREEWERGRLGDKKAMGNRPRKPGQSGPAQYDWLNGWAWLHMLEEGRAHSKNV